MCFLYSIALLGVSKKLPTTACFIGQRAEREAKMDSWRSSTLFVRQMRQSPVFALDRLNVQAFSRPQPVHLKVNRFRAR